MMLAGSANRPLAEEIAETLGIPLGRTTIRRFSDGEIFVRIDENVRGRDTELLEEHARHREVVVLPTMNELGRGCATSPA